MIRLARVHTCIGGLLMTLLGAQLAGGVRPGPSGLAALVIVLLIAAAQTYNDARDVVGDRINKPLRPVAAGQVTPRQAMWASAIYTAVALAASLPLGIQSLATAGTLAFASYAYSRGLKGTPVLGNALVGATSGWAVIYGALAVGRVPGVVVAAWIMISVYVTAFEVLKTVRDKESDLLVGLRTVAVVSEPASLLLFRLLAVMSIAGLVVIGTTRGAPTVFYAIVLIGVIAPAAVALRLAGSAARHPGLVGALRLLRWSWFPALAAMFLL